MNERRTTKNGRGAGVEPLQMAYFPLRGSDGAEMLRERGGFGVVGVFEAAIEGTEFGRSTTAGVSDEGELLADLLQGTNRGGVSRRRLVSFLHTGSFGKNHPTAPD